MNPRARRLRRQRRKGLAVIAWIGRVISTRPTRTTAIRSDIDYSFTVYGVNSGRRLALRVTDEQLYRWFGKRRRHPKRSSRIVVPAAMERVHARIGFMRWLLDAPW